MRRRELLPPDGVHRLLPERGAAAIELALLVPAFVALLAVMVGGGRIWLARSAVTEAAGAAARAATLQRSAADAEKAARRTVSANLADSAVVCRHQSVQVDTSAFAKSPGVPGTVTVRVSCEVGLSDLLLPGLPGSVRADATGTSALDTYRGRR